jgi:pSer/pThr/pTyr-binding forkhead associated (FHA) protein
MSYLIVDGERYALPIGEVTLGGSVDELFAGSRLAALPCFAVVAHWPEAPTTIERLHPGPTVLLDGRPLGQASRVLRHGSRIAVAGIEIVHGDVSAIGGTAHVRAIGDADLALLSTLAPGAPTMGTGGRIVPLGRGDPVAVPAEGLVIGRDPACDLVLRGPDVSRRHATVVASAAGYTILDESANGVFVNGTRVEHAQRLCMGDLVRVGDDEFRFEATTTPATDAAPAAPLAGCAAPRASAERLPDRTGEQIAALAHDPAPAAPAAALATLVVVSGGALQGTRFELARPVAHLGRGDPNDVRLADGSVSGSHATLAVRGGTWHLLDVGSTNGSAVDGAPVTRERALPSTCTVRLGDVELAFRASGVAAPPDGAARETRGVVDARVPARS